MFLKDKAGHHTTHSHDNELWLWHTILLTVSNSFLFQTKSTVLLMVSVLKVTECKARPKGDCPHLVILNHKAQSEAFSIIHDMTHSSLQSVRAVWLSADQEVSFWIISVFLYDSTTRLLKTFPWKICTKLPVYNIHISNPVKKSNKYYFWHFLLTPFQKGVHILIFEDTVSDVYWTALL